MYENLTETLALYAQALILVLQDIESTNVGRSCWRVLYGNFLVKNEAGMISHWLVTTLHPFSSTKKSPYGHTLQNIPKSNSKVTFIAEFLQFEYSWLAKTLGSGPLVATLPLVFIFLLFRLIKRSGQGSNVDFVWGMLLAWLFFIFIAI